MESNNLKVAETQSSLASTATVDAPSALDIQIWLVEYLAELLEVDASEINANAAFTSHGLDSLTMAGMASDLSTWLGRELSPDSAYKFPSIQELAIHLATQSVE